MKSHIKYSKNSIVKIWTPTELDSYDWRYGIVHSGIVRHMRFNGVGPCVACLYVIWNQPIGEMIYPSWQPIASFDNKHFIQQWIDYPEKFNNEVNSYLQEM